MNKHEAKHLKKGRVNTVISGEPATWLDEWKKRGIVTSYTDVVIQSLRAFNEKITLQDLKQLQLRKLRNNEEEW